LSAVCSCQRSAWRFLSQLSSIYEARAGPRIATSTRTQAHSRDRRHVGANHDPGCHAGCRRWTADQAQQDATRFDGAPSVPGHRRRHGRAASACHGGSAGTHPQARISVSCGCQRQARRRNFPDEHKRTRQPGRLLSDAGAHSGSAPSLSPCRRRWRGSGSRRGCLIAHDGHLDVASPIGHRPPIL
jgi:hypothetical protein